MPVPLDMPERAIVRAVNLERAARGLPGLRVSKPLSRAAGRHSRDQLRQDRLGHLSADGTTFTTRVARAGRFRAAGEVIAFTPRGDASRARAVVRLWMRSPSHRAQVLHPRYRIVGLGRVSGRLAGRHGAVVTADFARR